MDTPDRKDLIATRSSLHVVAEHVLLPDLYDRTGRISLRQAPGGFSTPPYDHVDGSTRRLRVEGTDVVDERDGRDAARVPLGSSPTLSQVRATLGVTAAPPSDIYDMGSEGNADRVLTVDPASAELVASLFAVAQQALAALQAEARAETGRCTASEDDGISLIQLWPEHLDLACSIDEVTYGASAGDGDHPDPYLYVVPWIPPTVDGPWNDVNGATRTALAVPPVGEALAWFRQIRAASRA